jgi:hypothetical protein
MGVAQFEPINPFDQRGQQRLNFKPRQVHAGATVDTVPEAQLLGDLAPDGTLPPRAVFLN